MIVKVMRRVCLPLVLVVGVAACGTTYELAKPDDAVTHRAALLFEKGQSEGARKQLSRAAAERRFNRVKAKVAPVGEAMCLEVAKEKPDTQCGVHLAIDRDMRERNAYFTFEHSRPVIRLSMPLLQDSANDDEVAFVIGHEYGHLLGKHLDKRNQQALVGALILGSLAAAANASADRYDPRLVENSMSLGAAVGMQAYSQTYELESDTVGTYITHAAGYDPVAGAMFFARPEPAHTDSGRLSFWGTHPPDEKRVATVLATVEKIEANIALQEK